MYLCSSNTGQKYMAKKKTLEFSHNFQSAIVTQCFFRNRKTQNVHSIHLVLEYSSSQICSFFAGFKNSGLQRENFLS